MLARPFKLSLAIYPYVMCNLYCDQNYEGILVCVCVIVSPAVVVIVVIFGGERGGCWNVWE